MPCCRGDHDVNENKVMKLLGGNDIILASAEEVEQTTGAPVGFAGPVGVNCPVLLDQELTLMRISLSAPMSGSPSHECQSI